MLVLTRKKQEEIVIGGGIIVKVLEICGDRVKLGFTAPAAVAINRSEVFEADLRRAEEKKQKETNGVERQTP